MASVDPLSMEDTTDPDAGDLGMANAEESFTPNTNVSRDIRLRKLVPVGKSGKYKHSDTLQDTVEPSTATTMSADTTRYRVPEGRPREDSMFQYVNLSKGRKQDVRAQQRTFEGAYVRTALGQLSFALVILKLFNDEFIPIATIFTIYCLLVLLVSVVRKTRTDKVFLYHAAGITDEGILDGHFFETAGTIVLIFGLLTIGSYIAILYLLMRI